jgi:Vault protein inter-alpha-trypsin domain/von Willebrand factor type A domain/FecR protein
MSTENDRMCVEVEEQLTEILDGTASARLFDHLAGCDRCRDLRYEAERAGARVASAGVDFRPADDFFDRLVARLDAARPEDHAASAPRESAPRSTASATRASAGDTRSSADSGSVVVRSSPPEPGMETAATVFDPLAAAKAESVATTFDPLAAAKAEEAEGLSPAGSTEISSTLPSESEGAGGVHATTHHGPITGSKKVSPTIDEKLDTRAAIEAELGEAPVKAKATIPDDAPAKEAAKGAAKAPAKAAAKGKVSFLRRPAVLAGVVGTLAAAAAVAFYVKGRGPHADAPVGPAPWSGQVAKVTRASADKSGGFEWCNAEGACKPMAEGAAIKAGWTLKTDARTRAYVSLADGTELALDRASEVELSKTDNRSARVKRGTVVADVSHVEGQTAHFWFPSGDVEVLGTKLSISATDDRASIEVARGTVRVRPDGGKWSEVRAGEEATLLKGQEPVIASSASIADTMEWSDKKPEEVDSPVLRGLGELRAKKPGQTKEKDHAVRLAKHAVKVRIVDVVARTEVDETFANDTDEELEGIFRFPLPPGAQIEKLSLEVDGKMIDGAFVDRDKGAAIFRGAVQQAIPKAQRVREEIIWVPGPWRDPALLEWQRGGRFELKIFPIPKRGSRHVVLTYTQTVDQAAGVRRFTYPLAHDPSGTTKVDSFDMDVQVLGADKSVPLSTRGYELTSASGDGDRRTMHADGFIPAGDLTVEYALPDRDKEATAWAYVAAPEALQPATLQRTVSKPQTPEERAAAATAAAILNDSSPYVAIALRPKLPRWQEAKERLHVIVVDSSRSMVGERFARARMLASSLVREMDRRDSFVVLACDTVCRPMSGEAAGSAKPEAPGAPAAEAVERFLGGIEPDGGSDLAAAMSAARTAAGSINGKELRVIYLGDGTPSVGPTRPAHLEAAVRNALPTGDNAVIAVALGADADTTSLAAMARGGGGVVVPYVPGQKVSSAALDVLGAAYGVVLRDPEVELPAGLSQVSPARLDSIRSGGETILVARMSNSDLSGTVKLRGRVAGERFEQTYPLKVVASSSAGNAFVPRLYAAAKIADLERAGDDAQKPTVIELSKRFSVASRFTSLLVLESEAMFKAFGLDRSGAAPSFTGEQQAQSSTADAEGDLPDDGIAGGDDKAGEKAKGDKPAETKGDLSLGSSSPLPAKKASRAADEAEADAPSLDRRPGGGGSVTGGAGRSGGFAAPADQAAPAPAATMGPGQANAPSTPAAPKGGLVAADPFDSGSSHWRPPPPPRRLIAMRKVFDRHVAFDEANTFTGQNAAKLVAAESALSAAPDSRDKTVDLFALYSTSGRLNEAQELTSKWAGRDALDPDALMARADLAARQGDRDRAIRILGGLADVRPTDKAIQTRLADLQETLGNTALACEHRLALADMAMTDAKLVSDAIRCTRAQRMIGLASVIKLDAGDKIRDTVDKLLLVNPTPKALAGDVQVSADWTGGADLDIALIDAQGHRISWLGGPGKSTATARDVTSTHAETLGVSGLTQGSYVVEISRASGANDGTPIRGDLTMRLDGDVRKRPFTLTGARVEAGTVRVFFTSHLEPIDFGFGRWH